MSEYRKVITKPGEILDYETVFEENPYLRTGVPEKMERLPFEYHIIISAVHHRASSAGRTDEFRRTYDLRTDVRHIPQVALLYLRSLG